MFKATIFATYYTLTPIFIFVLKCLRQYKRDQRFICYWVIEGQINPFNLLSNIFQYICTFIITTVTTILGYAIITV